MTRLAFGKLALQQEPLDLREVAGCGIEALEASGRLAAHPVTAEMGPRPVPV